MDFTIQYFGEFDRLLHVEIVVNAYEMIEALDNARSVLKQPALDGDPRLVGYVILDGRGRQVARGYRRDL
jgi:hypothetical protein